jgi:hypothetical protein
VGGSRTFQHLLPFGGDDFTFAAIFLFEMHDRWVPKQLAVPSLLHTVARRYQKGIAAWLGCEDTPASPLSHDKVSAGLAHFLSTTRFPNHLLLISDGTLVMRLLSQRFELAGVATLSARGSTHSASYLREHMLRVRWRYPLLFSAIHLLRVRWRYPLLFSAIGRSFSLAER